MLASKKKHPQFILALQTSYFTDSMVSEQGINQVHAPTFLQQIQSSLIIGEREMLDNIKAPGNNYKGNRDFRQILPYIIVRQVGHDGVTRYIPYRRTEKVGESRLAGNVSVGFGGHIDLGDIVFDADSVIDLIKTIDLSAKRELVEELKIVINGVALSKDELKELFNTLEFTEMASQIILDDTNDVGCVHAGFIGVLDVPADWHVQCGEDQLVTMPAMTAQELLGSGFPLENWTKFYLESVVPQYAEAV